MFTKNTLHCKYQTGFTEYIDVVATRSMYINT